MTIEDTDLRRQLRLIMLLIAEIKPGAVCMDTACPQAQLSGVPHMANDSGPHPNPYGVIETPTHKWRRKHWWER